MLSGIFPLTERAFDFGDTMAQIEITDDRRIRMIRLDADPRVPERLLFDLPASAVHISGAMGTLVIRAGGKTYSSEWTPEVNTMIMTRSNFVGAARHIAKSGIREWVQAFRRAGCRTRFLSYAAVIWIGVALSVAIIAGAVVYAWGRTHS